MPPYRLCILPPGYSPTSPRRKVVIKASSDASAATTLVELCLTERIKHKGLQQLKPPPPYPLQSHLGLWRQHSCLRTVDPLFL
jgi:hypothetical protein